MNKQPSSIHVVITGGTIDSYYEPSKDTAVPREKSVIPQFFSLLKLSYKVEFTEICMKDSRELTKEDIQEVLKVINESSHKHFILTHGTYTMVDTARSLEGSLENTDKTIVVTGSMIPLEGFSPSDAGFNLGYAIAQLEHLEPGVYGSMNGQVFSPNEMMKILSEGRFESIFSRDK